MSHGTLRVMHRLARARTIARLAMVAAPALAGVVALEACGSEIAPPSIAIDGSTVEREAPVFGESMCGACVASACPSERRGCESEPGCARYLACADACPSASSGNVATECEVACARPDDPAGVAALEAWSACRIRGAGASCVSCGPALRYLTKELQQICSNPAPGPAPRPYCSGAVPEAIERCRKCQYQACCDSRRACDDSTGCSALRECMRDTCVGSTAKCLADHDGGIDLAAPLYACSAVRCPDCGAEDACSVCAYQRCGDQYFGLLGNREGFVYQQCLRDCSGDGGLDACRAGCRSAHPALKQQLNDYDLCVIARCAIACGG